MRQKHFYIKGTDILIASQYTRVVIGKQGAYVEFDGTHFETQLIIKPGQEYRGNGKYAYCKYLWYCPVVKQNVKVYRQLRTVDYADYKVGMYYIDPVELDWEGELYAEQGSGVGQGLSVLFTKEEREKDAARKASRDRSNR